MLKNLQNTMRQTTLKRYNQFRGVRTEAIIWLQSTADTGKKLKVETGNKERDH